MINYNIAVPFYRNYLERPDKLALAVRDLHLTYADLGAYAQKISAWLQRVCAGKVGRVGILGSRSMMSCAGVLGTGWAGGTYVPIGLKLPEDRLENVIFLSQLDALITDESGASFLSEKILAVCPPHIMVPSTRLSACEQYKLYAFDALSMYWHPPLSVGPDETAYIEFTSGTTGTPKGVMISTSALSHYISMIHERYRIIPEDRIAETADLTFDLSVSNMFSAWNAGASLHVILSTQAMAPLRFIQDNQITFWFSVPSIITFMKTMNALPVGAFPTLRYSIFAGESLSESAALAWQQAAPHSLIDNAYGPTETTIICIAHRVLNPPLCTPGRDTIAIGTPLSGSEVVILNSDLQVVSPGKEGEIALAGPQLAIGYFGSPELTAARFRVIGGKRWYLTGDQGLQDKSGIFHHLGRFDNQVKVRGNRVELEDIEAHLRAVCGAEIVAAVAWPIEHGSARGIVGFISDSEMAPAQIRKLLIQRLPSYMVPNSIRRLNLMPVTTNGKVDRKALLALLVKNAP